MKQARFWLWLMVIGFALFCGTQLIADDERGCYFTYYWNSGKFGWEPFLKVAHPQDGAMDENGEPYVWGFRPWNLEPPDEKGLTYPVNITRYIPADRKMHLVIIRHPSEDRQVERSIRCPDGLW